MLMKSQWEYAFDFSYMMPSLLLFGIPKNLTYLKKKTILSVQYTNLNLIKSRNTSLNKMKAII